jgi:hypothetical protein
MRSALKRWCRVVGFGLIPCFGLWRYSLGMSAMMIEEFIFVCSERLCLIA